MSYSLKIYNTSGTSQTVAIFQISDPPSGFSLVWQVKSINNNNNYEFKWEKNWGIGWGSTSEPLNTGVFYSSRIVTDTKIDPENQTGTNSLLITYKNDDFLIKNPTHDSNLEPGSMQINTDLTFTVEQSSNMIVAVYMQDKPILIAQGKPNSHYQFNTNTNYYLTVTDYKEGQVLPPLSSISNNLTKGNLLLTPNYITMVVSTPIQVNFDNSTSVEYSLNNSLNFVKK